MFLKEGSAWKCGLRMHPLRLRVSVWISEEVLFVGENASPQKNFAPKGGRIECRFWSDDLSCCGIIKLFKFSKFTTRMSPGSWLEVSWKSQETFMIMKEVHSLVAPNGYEQAAVSYSLWRQWSVLFLMKSVLTKKIISNTILLISSSYYSYSNLVILVISMLISHWARLIVGQTIELFKLWIGPTSTDDPLTNRRVCKSLECVPDFLVVCAEDFFVWFLPAMNREELLSENFSVSQSLVSSTKKMRTNAWTDAIRRRYVIDCRLLIKLLTSDARLWRQRFSLAKRGALQTYES